MGVKMRSKNGQVTIFIILALIIAIAIVAVFVLFGKYRTQTVESLVPQVFIDKCAKDAVSLSADKIIENAGVIEPENFILYKSEKYNYLCYQKNYYLGCVNQYPMLKEIAESEIKKDTESEIRDCFSSLKDELEAKGYSVSEGNLDYSVEIVPRMIKIKIQKKFDVSKGEQTQRTSKFDTQMMSPLYNLIMTAREIVNQESQYCNFEYNGFMLLYPAYDIKRFVYDESRLYKVTDRQSGKLFKFAVRSCAFPPGY